MARVATASLECCKQECVDSTECSISSQLGAHVGEAVLSSTSGSGGSRRSDGGEEEEVVVVVMVYTYWVNIFVKMICVVSFITCTTTTTENATQCFGMRY